MATVFYAVVVKMLNGDEVVRGEVVTEGIFAEIQLGHTPRNLDARIVALTEATPDREAEIATIRSAFMVLEKTTAADRLSADKIIEARRLLGSLLKAGG